MNVPPPPTKASPESRRETLNAAVNAAILQGGDVATQSDYSAVIRYGQQTNHLLHAVLTFFTCGVWALIWGLVALQHSAARQSVMIEVDTYGRVMRSKAPRR